MPLSVENLPAGPIVDGDAGVILKADGSFQIFTTGHINPQALTPAQEEQGRKLVALATALSVPQLMDMLIEASRELGADEPMIDIGVTH